MPPSPGYVSVIQPGDVYGKLTVLKALPKHVTPGGAKFPKWLCRCACGNEKGYLQNALRAGNRDTKSCGCHQTGGAKEIQPGDVFERWTVRKLRSISAHHEKIWACVCECGTKKDVKQGSLRAGTSKSCGCLSAEMASARFTKHGVSQHPLYGFYQKMMEAKECGRIVYKKWVGKPERFIAWVGDTLGERPSDHMLGCSDTEAGYTPDTLSWVPRKEGHFFLYQGKKRGLREIAELADVDLKLLRQRLWTSGMTLDEALKQPVKEQVLHGLWKHPLRPIFDGIRARCYHEGSANYHYYGARGITMCRRLKRGLTSFVRWMEDTLGEKPTPKHSFDRIDNDKGYWCGECSECTTLKRTCNLRWADPITQANNKRSTLLFAWKGKQRTIRGIAEKERFDYKILRKRIVSNGWSVSRSLGEPKSLPKGKRP